MLLARVGLAGIALGLFTAVGASAADWKEPKEGLLNEKQLTGYLQVQKEVIAQWKASGKALEGSQSSAAAMAVMLRNDANFKDNLARHGMSQEEYNWVGSMAWEAWGGILMDNIVTKAQVDLDKQRQGKQKELADLRQKLATYEKARKDGRRVMTKEERESAVNSATEEQKSALEEARQHAEEAKQARDDATKADNDAKSADAAAKNPPADVSADDRPGFIEQKKSDAQTARDAAKEARDKEAEAKKAEADSRAKADAAGGRIKNPDAPTTDEEKAEIKKQNEDMIASTKGEIDNTTQAMKILEESGGAMMKQVKENKTKEKIPQQNIDLLKKHQKEFQDAWGIKNADL
jgi:hypothetical protein